MDELQGTTSDEHDPESFLQAVSAAPTLALAGFALAVSSLFGVGLLSGYTYLPSEDATGKDFGGSALVPATLLGAAFAAVISGLSYRAWKRADAESPSWLRPVALAGTIVAGLSLLGRAVVAIQEMSGYSSGFGRF